LFICHLVQVTFERPEPIHGVHRPRKSAIILPPSTDSSAPQGEACGRHGAAIVLDWETERLDLVRTHGCGVCCKIFGYSSAKMSSRQIDLVGRKPLFLPSGLTSRLALLQRRLDMQASLVPSQEAHGQPGPGEATAGFTQVYSDGSVPIGVLAALPGSTYRHMNRHSGVSVASMDSSPVTSLGSSANMATVSSAGIVWIDLPHNEELAVLGDAPLAVEQAAVATAAAPAGMDGAEGEQVRPNSHGLNGLLVQPSLHIALRLGIGRSSSMLFYVPRRNSQVTEP
jgi:hypothetical protein